jgi:hypothetical protein
VPILIHYLNVGHPYLSQMSQSVGVQATKYDDLVSELPIEIDQQQSIKLLYDVARLEDTAQIKRIVDEGVEISYPIEYTDPVEVDAVQWIESQFAAHNQKKIDDLDDRSKDQAICQLLTKCLNEEGTELPDDRVTAARVRALFLKRVRGMDSTGELIEYLENNPSIAKLVGFDTKDSVPAKATFSKVRQEFGMNERFARNSVQRIQRALFRNGIIHEIFSNSKDTPSEAIPQSSNLPPGVRYLALINYCDLVLERLTSGITFNRGENTSHTVREVIAAIAAMVLYNNFNKAWQLAQLQYLNRIISPSQIRNIIRKNIGIQQPDGDGDFYRSKQKIESLGQELNKDLLRIAADEIGFFSEPVDIAFDTTWISVESDRDRETVAGAMGQGAAGDGFDFATGVGITSTSQFSLGVSLVTKKSQKAQEFDRLIHTIEPHSDISWILADREFDNPDPIELFRSVVGSNWIIRGKDHPDVITNDEYDELQKNGKGTIQIGDTKVQAFWKDTSESNFGYSPRQSDSDNFILFTDAALDKTNISDIIPIYSKRWWVESHIRELKYGYSPQLPDTSGLNILFYLNIGSVFFNIKQLIDQSLSPRYGLPLSPRYYEILLGIIESTFRKRRLQPNVKI